MRVDIPLSGAERWDEMAAQVKRARGAWVLVSENPKSRRGGRNDKVREALERRGLAVEVRSRTGHDNAERPWLGVRTWARIVKS